MHRLLIIIHYTVHRSLALQQLALAVSLVTVVGVIGDVSDRRISIRDNRNDTSRRLDKRGQRHSLQEILEESSTGLERRQAIGQQQPPSLLVGVVLVLPCLIRQLAQYLVPQLLVHDALVNDIIA